MNEYLIQESQTNKYVIDLLILFLYFYEKRNFKIFSYLFMILF